MRLKITDSIIFETLNEHEAFLGKANAKIDTINFIPIKFVQNKIKMITSCIQFLQKIKYSGSSATCFIKSFTHPLCCQGM
jgi:hypothetical protein